MVQRKGDNKAESEEAKSEAPSSARQSSHLSLLVRLPVSLTPPHSLWCSLSDVWPPSLNIMTRLPVIFYFTARPRRRKTCGGKGEETKLLGSEGGDIVGGEKSVWRRMRKMMCLTISGWGGARWGRWRRRESSENSGPQTAEVFKQSTYFNLLFLLAVGVLAGDASDGDAGDLIQYQYQVWYWCSLFHWISDRSMSLIRICSLRWTINTQNGFCRKSAWVS